MNKIQNQLDTNINKTMIHKLSLNVYLLFFMTSAIESFTLYIDAYTDKRIKHRINIYACIMTI